MTGKKSGVEEGNVFPPGGGGGAVGTPAGFGYPELHDLLSECGDVKGEIGNSLDLKENYTLPME